MTESLSMIHDTLHLMSGARPAVRPQPSKGVSQLISMLIRDKAGIEAALKKIETNNVAATLTIDFLDVPTEGDHEVTLNLYGGQDDVTRLLERRLEFINDRLTAVGGSGDAA